MTISDLYYLCGNMNELTTFTIHPYKNGNFDPKCLFTGSWIKMPDNFRNSAIQYFEQNGKTVFVEIS